MYQASSGVKATQAVTDLIIDVLMNGESEINLKEFNDGFCRTKAEAGGGQHYS